MIRLTDRPTSADRIEVTDRVIDRLRHHCDHPDTRQVVREVIDTTLSVLDPTEARPRHRAACVDDEGKIECVCGLEDWREVQIERGADRLEETS